MTTVKNDAAIKLAARWREAKRLQELRKRKEQQGSISSSKMVMIAKFKKVHETRKKSSTKSTFNSGMKAAMQELSKIQLHFRNLKLQKNQKVQEAKTRNFGYS